MQLQKAKINGGKTQTIGGSFLRRGFTAAILYLLVYTVKTPPERKKKSMKKAVKMSGFM